MQQDTHKKKPLSEKEKQAKVYVYQCYSQLHLQRRQDRENGKRNRIQFRNLCGLAGLMLVNYNYSSGTPSTGVEVGEAIIGYLYHLAVVGPMFSVSVNRLDLFRLIRSVETEAMGSESRLLYD